MRLVRSDPHNLKVQGTASRELEEKLGDVIQNAYNPSTQTHTSEPPENHPNLTT